MNIELIINCLDEETLTTFRTTANELRDNGNTVNVHLTFESGDAERFARAAREAGSDLVISAGGDGTLNEVVNGLIADRGDRGADALPRLGIVPLGTGNDFAGYLQIPETAASALEQAIYGVPLLCDVGAVNDRYFINVSSGGIGAEATEEASDGAKRILGSVAYFVTGVRKFAALNPSQATFRCGDETIFDGDFLFFAVGNGGRTGGGNWITPRARLDDGLLDLCIVETMGHAELLKLLPLLRSGEHVDHPRVLYRQEPEVRVAGLGDISVNVDGEPVAESSLDYSILPGALRVTGSRPLADLDHPPD